MIPSLEQNNVSTCLEKRHPPTSRLDQSAARTFQASDTVTDRLSLLHFVLECGAARRADSQRVEPVTCGTSHSDSVMARRAARQKNQLPPCYYEGFLEKRSFKDKVDLLWNCCGNYEDVVEAFATGFCEALKNV